MSDDTRYQFGGREDNIHGQPDEGGAQSSSQTVRRHASA
jgi:hypothetical protein